MDKDRLLNKIEELSINQDRKDLAKQIIEGKIWFCPLLFNHLYCDTDGSYKVCCIGQQNDFSIFNTSIQDWLNSDLLNKIREEMLQEGSNLQTSGIQCSRCMTQERNYGRSDRLKHIERFFEFQDINGSLLDHVLDFKSTGKFVPSKRSLIVQTRTFGNQCNLDCYMCQPQNSSTRMRMFKKLNLKNTVNFDNPDYYVPYNVDVIFQHLAELAPYIDVFMIQGGEPLVMKKQYDFLDVLIETGESKNIRLDMSSNLTILGHQKKNILDYLPSFCNLSINASIDSFGIYNDYIRRRSSWNDITSNLEKLQEYTNVNIEVFSTVSFLSILRLDLLNEWVEQKKLPQVRFILDDPSDLHVRHLPQKIKDNLLNKFSHDDQICNALQLERDEDAFLRTMKYIQKIDKHYKTNVFELFPELEEFM